MENLVIYFIYFFFFYFGAIIGSFLNVFVFELEPNVFKSKEKREKEKIESFWKRINRRSHCNSCNHNLEVLDLFPIFSYIFSFGKCRYCGQSFSPRYLFIEIFSGLVFLALFYKIFTGVFDSLFWFNFTFLTFIFSGLILIFLFDLKHKIIPNIVLYPLFVLSFIYLFLINFLTWDLFLYAGLASSIFWAIWFFSHGRAMGYADWKLVLLLGFFLKGLGQIYSFWILSFWYGAFYSLIMIWISKKYKMNSEIPFGPFIILAFWTVFIFNVDVIDVTARLMDLF